MYWLIPVGIIGIGALLYSALDNSAGQKRKEWESKYRQVVKILRLILQERELAMIFTYLQTCIIRQ